MIGAEGSNQIDLRGAAHAGDFSAERLGDLHGERAHASRRADDQHLLSRLHVRLADGLQRGTSGDGDGRGLLEGQVRRLGCELARLDAGVLGEGAVAGAVDLVARLELGHVLADGLDRSGEGPARVGGLGRADAEAREAHRVRQAGHAVPRAHVDAGGRHPHEYLVVADRRPGELVELQDALGLGAVAVLHDCLHRLHSGRDGRGVCERVERTRLHGFPAWAVIRPDPWDSVGEVLVHEPYAHGAFSGSRRDALGRVASHVTDGEHAGKRGLEWQA